MSGSILHIIPADPFCVPPDPAARAAARDLLESLTVNPDQVKAQVHEPPGPL